MFCFEQNTKLKNESCELAYEPCVAHRWPNALEPQTARSSQDLSPCAFMKITDAENLTF
jgi:hypothetical protein